jgi:DNA mismatch repair protein MutL
VERVLQVHKSYLVTEDEQGVVIVDQHALHERVMFEQLLERIREAPLESQRLLTPAVAPAAPAQIDLLPVLGPLLARIGVEAEAIGPTSVAVHAFPTFLFDKGVEPGEFIAELLERAEAEGFAPGSEQTLHEVLDMMACKAAIKAGDRMSEQELGELMQLRDQIERASNCPHGRPTTIRLTIRELEKLFRRG